MIPHETILEGDPAVMVQAVADSAAAFGPVVLESMLTDLAEATDPAVWLDMLLVARDLAAASFDPPTVPDLYPLGFVARFAKWLTRSR